MGQWLAELFLGHIKQFSTELFLKKKKSIFTQFIAKILSKFSQIIISLHFFIFYNLKKEKNLTL